ncbi:MAG: addiction module protein [Candidatus Desantisbacteria bacterium]
MVSLAEKIYGEVLDLPAEERFILIDKLIQSSTPSNKSIEDVWIVESEKRLQEYREGKVQAISGEEVFRKIHARLSK